MNILRNEIVRDYLPETALGGLPDHSKELVERALHALEENAEPAEYRCEKVEDRTFKISVPVRDGEVSILYDIWQRDRRIVLVDIKDVSRFRKTAKWIEGLLDFGP
jgi:hypothetical protein